MKVFRAINVLDLVARDGGNRYTHKAAAKPKATVWFVIETIQYELLVRPKGSGFIGYRAFYNGGGEWRKASPDAPRPVHQIRVPWAHRVSSKEIKDAIQRYSKEQ